MLVCIFNLYFA